MFLGKNVHVWETCNFKVFVGLRAKCLRKIEEAFFAGMSELHFRCPVEPFVEKYKVLLEKKQLFVQIFRDSRPNNCEHLTSSSSSVVKTEIYMSEEKYFPPKDIFVFVR